MTSSSSKLRRLYSPSRQCTMLYLAQCCWWMMSSLYYDDDIVILLFIYHDVFIGLSDGSPEMTASSYSCYDDVINLNIKDPRHWYISVSNIPKEDVALINLWWRHCPLYVITAMSFITLWNCQVVFWCVILTNVGFLFQNPEGRSPLCPARL